MDRTVLPRDHTGMLLAGRAVCIVALLLWASSLALFGLISQEVTYTVCDGPLLQLPPPSVHWPPEGHHLELLAMQGNLTLAAVATGMVGAFLLLYAQPSLGFVSRVRWLLITVGGSLVGAAILWLAVQHHVLDAQINALAGCL